MGKQLMVVIVLAAMACTAHAQGKPKLPQGRQLQCWTDDKGARACGDRVPPQYVKKEREVLDSQGRVIETKAREKTPEEVAAEEATKKLAKEMAERQEKQAKYDHFLTDTYNTEKELQHTRDERIATMDNRLKLIEKSISDNTNTLKQLKDRKAGLDKQQKTDKKLDKQIAEVEKALADSQDSSTQLQSDREAMKKKFDDDIARWRELKSANGG
jgi:hypothetical protein